MSEQSIRAPLQERSRRSLEAIYAAAIELLADGGWEAVTVGEIERRSGVTRGTFYLRFPARDALVDYVHERFMAEVRELQERTFQPLMQGGPLSLDEASRLAIRGMADVFAQVGRVMVHSERLDRPPLFPEGVADLSRDVAQVLARALGAEATASAEVRFVTELAFAAFVARQRPVPPFPGHPVLDDAAFVGRLAVATAAYLAASLPGAGG
jgi:AcrR family transcriptional regulator